MEGVDMLVRTHMSDQPTVVATRAGRIVYIGDNPDELADAVTARTTVIDAPGALAPGFIDTHNHLMLVARNQLGVPVATATRVGEIVDRIRASANHTPVGQWLVTAADWHELSLAEQRLPSRVELDRATDKHPLLVQRGGHVGVLNTAGLHAAGIASSEDMSGAERTDQSKLTGRVEDEALHAVHARLPPPDRDALAEALASASTRYAAVGLVAVRDPAVGPAEWHVYHRVHAEDSLAVRARAMLMTTRSAVAAAGSITGYLDQLEQEEIRPGTGDAMLDVWGLKLVVDGGVEAAALTEDYRDRPGYRGELLCDHDELTEMFTVAAMRGWPVGVHALGDRAIATALAAFRDVAAHGGLLPRGFVLEHGGLIDAAQSNELRRLGVHLTAQQALLDALALALVANWGSARTAELLPWRELLDTGVEISAGTDHPIGPLDSCVPSMA